MEFLVPPRQQQKERLAALEECRDLGQGFQLAERDMAIRGFGNIFGEVDEYLVVFHFLTGQCSEKRGIEDRKWGEEAARAANKKAKAFERQAAEEEFRKTLQIICILANFRKVFSNVSPASVVDISNCLRCFRLKGCCSEYYSNSFRNNDNNGVQNLKAYAPCLQSLLRDLEEVVTVEDPQNRPNSWTFSGARSAAASTNRESSTGFRDQHFAEKIMVAVDVDEVLGNFISALNQFIANCYSLNHSISEYHVYEFFKIWNCSRDEADIR
ncbi:Uncharacterized protein Adt_27775 [Abeliophyllum distichum]|uniref:Uncharacterized protein n=1 Tax=Abeliophyllum distichum TaxID=126358 RepID=A0ABD1RUP2_9LAMI